MPSRDKKTGQFVQRYTLEQTLFIMDTYPENGPQKTAELFNEKFNQNVTKDQIYTKAKGLKIHWHGRNRWSKEMLDYLKENYAEELAAETAKAMNEKFGTHFTAPALLTKASDLGIKRVNKPQNFKKGVTNPYLDSAPIGTVSSWQKYKGISYPMIKISDKVGGQARKENWILYKNYVWEQNNGKIPEGYYIAVADGDESNCDIENLRCIPRKYQQLLCHHNHWYGKGKEIFDAGIAWCDLHYMLKEKGE